MKRYTIISEAKKTRYGTFKFPVVAELMFSDPNITRHGDYCADNGQLFYSIEKQTFATRKEAENLIKEMMK